MSNIPGEVEVLSNNHLTTRLAILVGAGSMALGACGSDRDGTTLAEAESIADVESTVAAKISAQSSAISKEVSDTVPEGQVLIDNIFNNTNGQVDCYSESFSSYLNVLELPDGLDGLDDDAKFVQQVNLSNLPKDSNLRDESHRIDTNSVGSPITADPSNLEEVKNNLYATFCEQPAVLAAWVVSTANKEILGVSIGNNVEWLKPYVGMTTEDVNNVAEELSAIPHTADEYTVDQINENLAAVKIRTDLAENLANALNNMQMSEIQYDIAIVDSLALRLPDAEDVSVIPEYVNSGYYMGDAITFTATAKEGTPEECEALVLGGNVDDQRPLTVDEGVDCETPEEPEVTEETTTTTTPGVVTTTTNPSGVTTTTTPTTPETTPTTIPDGTKAEVPTTLATSSDITVAPNTTLTPPPATAPADTLAPGVTPTTHDFVPPASTIQAPDAPPVTAKPPTTEAPAATIATSTTVTNGRIVSP